MNILSSSAFNSGKLVDTIWLLSVKRLAVTKHRKMERVKCLYHESSNVYLSMKLAIAKTEKENLVFTYSSVSRELFIGL